MGNGFAVLICVQYNFMFPYCVLESLKDEFFFVRRLKLLLCFVFFFLLLPVAASLWYIVKTPQ